MRCNNSRIADNNVCHEARVTIIEMTSKCELRHTADCTIQASSNDVQMLARCQRRLSVTERILSKSQISAANRYGTNTGEQITVSN